MRKALMFTLVFNTLRSNFLVVKYDRLKDIQTWWSEGVQFYTHAYNCICW